MSDKNEDSPDDGDVTRTPQDLPLKKELSLYMSTMLKRIRPSKASKTEVEITVRGMQKALIASMRRQDMLFNTMFHKTEIAGSVRGKMKVGKPDEFDLNFYLKLPLRNNNEIKVIHSDNFPDYSQCSFEEKNLDWPVEVCDRRKVWHKLFQKNDHGLTCLNAAGARRWMQSMVDRALHELQKRAGHEDDDQTLPWDKVKTSQSGPAVTLIVDDMSMDLVPAFLLTDDIEKDHLVPAPPKVSRDGGEQKAPETLFRHTFPLREAKLLANRGYLKDIIKLLKVIRDRNDWDPIASIYLCNLCVQCFEDGTLVKSNEVAPGLLTALHRLRECLDDRCLPKCNTPNRNLFVHFSPKFCENISQRLQRLLKRIDSARGNKDKEKLKAALDLLFRVDDGGG